MKVGILTLFHGNVNWGGVLQGYALKTLIEENFENCSVDLIRYKSGENVVYKSRLQQAGQYSVGGAMEKVRQIFDKAVHRRELSRTLKGRRELFKAFTDSVSDNKNCVYTDECLGELESEYDCLICGSDQVWNPNVAKPGYFLKNVGDGCRKIAYGASIARNDLSPKERAAMVPLIEKFHWISVREKTAQQFLQKYLGETARVHEVIDPALMLSREKWEELIGEKNGVRKKYVLAFFFSDSSEQRKTIKKYCQERKLEFKFICWAQNKYLKSDKKGDCTRLYDIGPIEFLKLFQGAEAVFTDSFHGSVFSLIFHNPFVVFERDKKGHLSKNSRLYDLLDKFRLSDKLVRGADFIDVLEKGVDFEKTDKLLEKYRRESMDFLKNAIGNDSCYVKKTVKRVDGLAERDCIGCGYCSSICPNDCITMEYDREGFPYPAVDGDKCTDCGLCIKSCVCTGEKKKSRYFDTYVGYNQDFSLRMKSSSGGIFAAVANKVLAEGGVVYGAAFDDDFTLRHTRVDSREDMDKLYTSKYVQSSMDGVYKSIENDLAAGKTVLFCGAPCQAAAVGKLSEKGGWRENLVLVDFICHGVPSPGVWKSYLDYVRRNREVAAVNFRDKERSGWHDFCLRIDYKNKGSFNESREKNAYMRSFLGNKNLRPSCYKCMFKGTDYASDITLGDAWKIEKDCPLWADDKGISVIISRTRKGWELLDGLPDNIPCKKTDYELWCRLNRGIEYAAVPPKGRKEFFESFKSRSNKEFWNENKRIPVKARLKYGAKKTARILGIADFLREKM